jgi:hypothetical protein
MARKTKRNAVIATAVPHDVHERIQQRAEQEYMTAAAWMRKALILALAANASQINQP